MNAITEAAMNAALVNELCSGRKLMETREQLREQLAGREAHAMRGHRSIKGLGKLAAVIPQHEFFTIAAKYGSECWDDPGFVRDFQRLEPSMAVHKV